MTEQLERIIIWIFGGGMVAFLTWALALKTQLHKLKNDIINSDSDTTDKSLEVSMKLIKTNEMLQEKVATMMQHVQGVLAELSDVKADLTKSKKQIAEFVSTCTCGAAQNLG